MVASAMSRNDARERVRSLNAFSMMLWPAEFKMIGREALMEIEFKRSSRSLVQLGGRKPASDHLKAGGVIHGIVEPAGRLPGTRRTPRPLVFRHVASNQPFDRVTD